MSQKNKYKRIDDTTLEVQAPPYSVKKEFIIRKLAEARIAKAAAETAITDLEEALAILEKTT